MAIFEGSIGTPSGGFNLKVEYSINQSVLNNYSDITATGYVKRNKSTYYPYNSTSSASLNIEGNVASASPSYNLGSDGYKAIMSHSARIYHNSDGTKSITISFSFNGKLSNYYPNGSISQTITLPRINRKANINSFIGNDIEGNFSVNYTSYVSSYTYKLRLSIPNVARLETFEYSSGTTFNFSNETITYLYNYMKNTNSVSIGAVIETWDGNNKIGESEELINVCVINNANPIFNNFVFEDTNPTTIALTGNNQSIIQGYSNVKATIPVEYIAKPQKGANMIKYSYICGDVQKDILYSSEEKTSNTIENVKLGVFNVYAIDSRNNSTLVTKNANTTISYNPLLKDNINVLRDNGISENTKLSLKGTINLVNFGMVTNSIKSAKFRYKPTDTSTWSEYKEINVSVDETGNYLFNDNIMGDTDDGFDISNSYNIEVLISDELSSVTFTANLPSGIPNIALHKNGVGIMGKYDTNEGGLFQIGSKNIFKYSTEETDTGFKWIDGKKLYRRVVPVTFEGSSDVKTTAHGIANLEEVIDKTLKWYDNEDKTWYTNDKDAGSNATYFVKYNGVDNTNVKIMAMPANYDWQSRTRARTITLIYTKTTD